MCGRFVRESTIPDIAEAFGIENVSSDLEPSYNIAPTQMIAAIIDDGQKQLVEVRWGLIPSWAEDPAIGNRMINARAETVTEKASFKNAFKKRRCLIVADGFYEWKKEGDSKRPVFIRLKSRRPFGFAGLYENWTSPLGEQITSCAIITTEPNDLMRTIHQRMPVIVPKDKEDLWLAGGDEADMLALLTPYSSEEMEAYGVSRKVNSPANDSPDCIRPTGVI
ncbi:MAG: SOS response-associated peptidase [Blastocatellia bacterium]|nr:SOS response-associated peptidase [Blastocatellia bacterium]